MDHHIGRTAAEFAAQEVAEWVASAPINRRSPGENLLWWKLGCDYRTGPRGSYIVMYDSMRAWLVSAAKHDAEARKLLCGIIASKLYSGVPLSEGEGWFAASVLDGTAPSLPKRRGRSLSENHERDVFIVSMLATLVDDFGITATRNDVSPRISACDLIAEAFASCGRHEVTYRAVKDVWTNKKFRILYDSLAAAVNGELAKRREKQEKGIMNALSPSYPHHLSKN
ncbi:hypothetical protein [Paracoccus pantotrophus]|uniref:hypothetical protein n=1 Tax=Paracoccus pantotrophus TaxID=82367 RepID=UPI001160874B|nr:hypothetical protein [Paracoccus pantotrophus]MDF3856385.1 hypothetical protein [Paracoccus pantotrophus]